MHFFMSKKLVKINVLYTVLHNNENVMSYDGSELLITNW